MPLAVRPGLHAVGHVLDQEQAPAAGLLAAGQLSVDVRFLGPYIGFGPALIGNRYDDLVGERGDLHEHGNVGTSFVAVLDGVHRGLRDGGLESFDH